MLCTSKLETNFCKLIHICCDRCEKNKTKQKRKEHIGLLREVKPKSNIVPTSNKVSKKAHVFSISVTS